MDASGTYIVVLAGPEPCPECVRALAAASKRYPAIAADAGYSLCRRMDIEPCIAVGDFDSLGYVPVLDRVEVHPCEKDESDGDLAFRAARNLCARRLLVFGAFGGRPDHEMANLQLLAREAEAGTRVLALGDGFGLSVMSGPGTMEFPPLRDGIVSVFSAGPVALGVSIQGLKYELEHGELTNRSSLGLSNEFCGKPAHISVESGTLFVFHPFGAVEW